MSMHKRLKRTNNITVLHHILLSFLSVLSGFLYFSHTRLTLVKSFEVFEGADFGLDETSFEVGVDDSSGLWSSGSLHNSPRSDLLWTGSEEGLQAQGLATRSNHSRDHRPDLGLWSLESSLFGLFCALFQKGFLARWVVFEVEESLFEFTRDGKDLTSSVFLHPVRDLWKPFVSFSNETLLREIDNINLRLCCDTSPITNDVNFGVFEFSSLDRSVRLNQLQCLRKEKSVRILGRKQK